MTRLELLANYTHVLHQRNLYPLQALALILMGERPLTIAGFVRSSGFSITACRRNLVFLCDQGLAERHFTQPASTFQLTQEGITLARELLASQPSPLITDH
jgi:hypothetical protein